jgi:hypothetical protein
MVFPNIHSIFDSMFQMMSHPFAEMNHPPTQYPRDPFFPPSFSEGQAGRPEQMDDQEDPFLLRQKRKHENRSQQTPFRGTSFENGHSDRI